MTEHAWLNQVWRLELPPSANDLWMPVIREGKPAVVKTPEYRDWCERALAELRLQGGQFTPIPGDMPIRVQCRFVLGRLSADQPNRTKALFDRLNGVVWHDDRQISCEGPHRKLIASGGEKPHVQFVLARDTECDDEMKQRLERAWREHQKAEHEKKREAKLAELTGLPVTSFRVGNQVVNTQRPVIVSPAVHGRKNG